MSTEDRLDYLYAELEQLKIKSKRYQLDTLRPKDDIAFYIKCNQYFTQCVTEEIKLLEKMNGAKQ